MREIKMSIQNKLKIYKKLKNLAVENNYSVSDLEVIEMTNSIIKLVKKETEKDYEHSKDYENENILAVDEVLSDDGWGNYCSNLVWAGPDFIESQKKKGIIKKFDHYRLGKSRK